MPTCSARDGSVEVFTPFHVLSDALESHASENGRLHSCTNLWSECRFPRPHQSAWPVPRFVHGTPMIGHSPRQRVVVEGDACAPTGLPGTVLTTSAYGSRQDILRRRRHDRSIPQAPRAMCLRDRAPHMSSFGRRQRFADRRPRLARALSPVRSAGALDRVQVIARLLDLVTRAKAIAAGPRHRTSDIRNSLADSADLHVGSRDPFCSLRDLVSRAPEDVDGAREDVDGTGDNARM